MTELNSELFFFYVSAYGRFSSCHVTKSSESTDHIQGFIDYRGKSFFRTFRKDRVIAFFDNAEEMQIALESVDVDKYEIDISPPKPHPVHTFDVHFTGFKKVDKQALIELAESKEMVVRKDVTKYLNLLCYGYNASQRKLDLARQQGVIILNQPEFTHFVETGEVPEFE